MIWNSKRILPVLIALVILAALRCSENPANPPETVTIDLPLHKKCVYAIANYYDFGEHDSLSYLRIASFQFDSACGSFDTTHLAGTYEYLEPDLNGIPAGGSILLSMTKDWVFFQNSEIPGAGIDLLKPHNGIKVDTTRLPTEKYSYLPVYPRTLIQNNTVAIYRPESAGIDWGYTGVYREFKVGGAVTWEDQYGSEGGIEVGVTHVVMDFTMDFELILDDHGIIRSQNSVMLYLVNENGALVDSVISTRINRRIVDYSEPSAVNSLSDYAAEVAVKGLLPLE